MNYEINENKYRYGIVLHSNDPGAYPEQISFQTEDDRDAAFNDVLDKGFYFSNVRGENVYPYRMYKFDIHPEEHRLMLNMKVPEWAMTSDSPPQKDYIGEWSKESCPKCGATLLENKVGQRWCSNAGGAHMSACRYGLGDDPIGVEGDAARQHP